MANSYNMYAATNASNADNLRFRTDNGPRRTDVDVDDRFDPGETVTELTILRNGERFFVPTDSGSAEIWSYMGNYIDPETGDATGFVGSRLTPSGETRYALFRPEASGPLPTVPRRIDVDPDDLDRDTGWLIEEGEPLCFVQGTLIATPSGAVAVEALATGDAVLTADGRTVAVRWIGRQRVHPRAASPRPALNRLPVRVAAGALGPDLPRRDLWLSGDHGLIVDGLLINAAALVNGTMIALTTAEDLPEQFTYYHVETEAHDEILAEGLPAETFIDYAGRRAFDNFADYVTLYGGEPVIPEMARPRISAARQLPPALAQRLGIEDFATGVTQEAAALMRQLTAA